MSRDALVIGINDYANLNNLKKPANDAEAIAQLLETKGDFRVKRLPCIEKEGKLCIHNSGAVGFEQLQQAIVQLFNPETDNLPETALLFFAGHGLRNVVAGIAEGYLATSDTNPKRYHWGLSLEWLKKLLQKSDIKQQVVWLDCCFSGELLNFDDADPGNRSDGDGRCFIAASREYEEAYESAYGKYGVLTEVLLRGLDADGKVDNYALADFIQQNLKKSVQQPLTRNSGSRIFLTRQPVEVEIAKLSGKCPYKGLRFFDEADAQYFYGRESLTDILIEKVRLGNFLAVLGVSGSGKSSVVRAGLLHQLKLGEKLGESRQWRICKPFTPREGEQTPLDNLAQVLVPPELSGAARIKEFEGVQHLLKKGATGFQQWLDDAVDAPRVLLVIDQFEEFFTRCERTERQQFFECVLGCLPPPEAPMSPFCLVITMRADFLGKCAEQDYAGLTRYIDAHQVTVTPMSETELEAAISKPAKKVGLDIEAELITAMLKEVEGPASLPLLEYTLTELCEHRQLNCLTLAAYMRLGGVQGTLQKSADRAYAALTAAEQSVAQWIFLELTQLGEGTEDTRKQVLKTDLVTAQHSAGLIDQVLDKLATARLVVVDALGSRSDKQPLVTVIDVAHEALIRHWGQLRQWIDENREFKRWKDTLHKDMLVWEQAGHKKDELLRGTKLLQAEDQANQQRGMLNEEELRFIADSVQERQKQSRNKQKVRFLFVLLLIVLLVTGGWGLWQRAIVKQQAEIMELTSKEALARLMYQGALEEKAKQYQPALNNYQKALKIARHINDYKAQANSLSSCGTIYMELNSELAVDSFKQAMEIRDTLNDTEGVRFEQKNLALAEYKLGKIEKEAVGFIEVLTCSNDAFKLSRGNQKLPLYIFMPIYYADELKVIKENCEIRALLKEGGTILISKANSPYLVLKKPSPFPSELNDAIISKWFRSLFIEQESERIAIMTR
jgi:tetratricopeptide (TPR) repeat protein